MREIKFRVWNKRKEVMDAWAMAFSFTVIMDIGIFGAISAAVGL